MNIYVLLLLVVPLLLAVLFALTNNKILYKVFSYILFIVGAISSIMLAVQGVQSFEISGTLYSSIETVVLIGEIAIIVFLYYISIKHKKWGVLTLTIISTVITIYSTLFMKKAEETTFNLDGFTLVMLLIINIVGTIIIVFANGYMNEYEHHRNMKSRQKVFFPVVCVFLSAMNGLVMSDSLGWIYFFWEITTLASFLLISYNQDAEAYKSGFRALFLNLIGGLAFSIGIVILGQAFDTTTLSEIIKNGPADGFAIIPIFLLCIAGFAKSAQMPFESWLLGAMVAPTPVSALLHSSTMVKAGVYLIIKLSPAYAHTHLGTAISIYGAVTFLIASAIAVSQRNAKRVLAYSTIANLGLIICSAGLGTNVAVSAAIILLIFHAVSKALLFLCTGQIEHTVGSRDIEDMTGLVHKSRLLALITSFALISMILPPFGVLVTKLLSLEASAYEPVVAILIILGSALTTLYYVKWIGTLIAYPTDKFEKQKVSNFSVFFPLCLLSVLVLLSSALIGFINKIFVEPEMGVLFPSTNTNLTIANNTNIITSFGEFNNEVIFILIAVVIVFAFIIQKLLIKNTVKKDIYMCGENNNSDDVTTFRQGDSTIAKSTVGNLYLSNFINEAVLTKIGSIISIILYSMFCWEDCYNV